MYSNDRWGNNPHGRDEESQTDTQAPDGWELHVEEPKRGGAAYLKCASCGVEVVASADVSRVEHREGCSREDIECDCESLPDVSSCWSCQSDGGEDYDPFEGEPHTVESVTFALAYACADGGLRFADPGNEEGWIDAEPSAVVEIEDPDVDGLGGERR